MSSDCGNVQKVFVPEADPPASPSEPIRGIKITDVAADKIKAFLKSDDKPESDYGLRVGVVKDGCSGHSYVMDLADLETAKAEGDKIFTKDGANVMIKKEGYLFVIGSILDYKEALTGSGFSLNNPNITGTCSCGSSFKV